MELEAVKAMLQDTIPDAHISVEGEGCNFTVTVISAVFGGKMQVARQKMVMAPFKALIASGDIHALGIKAMTPEEVDLVSL